MKVRKEEVTENENETVNQGRKEGRKQEKRNKINLKMETEHKIIVLSSLSVSDDLCLKGTCIV